MEIKTSKLAIIAGNGNIPFYLLDECEKKGRDYCLIIIEGHGKELANKYKVDFTVSLSKMGKAIKFVKGLEIKDILMVGGIDRPSLKNIIPDLWTAKFLAKMGSNIGGDNSILSNLTKSLEKEGFNILAPENIIPSLLCPNGVLGKHKPNKDNKPKPAIRRVRNFAFCLYIVIDGLTNRNTKLITTMNKKIINPPRLNDIN